MAIAIWRPNLSSGLGRICHFFYRPGQKAVFLLKKAVRRPRKKAPSLLTKVRKWRRIIEPHGGGFALYTMGLFLGMRACVRTFSSIRSPQTGTRVRGLERRSLVEANKEGLWLLP